MSTSKRKYIIILAGLLVRLIIMPFTVHHDLLSTARRVAILLFDRVFLIPYWAELNYAILLLPLKSWLTKLPENLAMQMNSNFSVVPGQVAYSTFLGSPEIYTTLFILKLPFLLVDMVLLVVVAKKMHKKIVNYIFWAFNPFVLYGVYMWGRYEILPMLFALLALLHAENINYKKINYMPVLLMGISVTYRVSFVIFLPLLVLYLSRRMRDAFLLIIISIAPYIVVTALVKYLGGGNSIEEYLNIALSAKIGEGFYSINLFLIAFCLVLFQGFKDKTTGVLSYGRFIAYTAFALLSYFGLSVFHPQYIAWISPVAIVLIDRSKNFFVPFMLLFVPFFLLVDVYYGCYTSVCLITEAVSPSFAHSFFAVKSVLIESVVDPNLIILFHTALLVIIIYVAYLVRRFIYEDKCC